ncbi:DUF4214 domain-containing protein [Noviherbaspirillum saxi]|uniref:DUF4214 domain-containing protein n=1 Tax=Noviherbaspirillum saxi TaxID=2320863 RepID=A0A3A3FIB2_9BURK|nr:DUF4214 domain-containing protein [Noviherbaspirillum saxi]RJF94984.1 DUF4214 domain-containing protein [Noviherbaspirillum saxi]
MALTATQTALTKLYVGAFMRAPEREGLMYWDAQLSSGTPFSQVVNTVFSLPVVKAIYPDSMTNAQFLTAVYTNVFGKVPDAGGLAYWNSQIGAGQQRGQVVTAMIDAGLNSPDGTPGKAFILNRVEAAKYVAELQLIRGTTVDEHKLIELITSIDESQASYQAGIAALEKAVAVPFGPTPGQTTGTGTASTDLFIFGNVDANNYRVINGLTAGDMVSVAAAADTNGDYQLASVGSAAAVDARGEWFFNAASDNLTYWNTLTNSAATVQLTGVNTVSVNPNAVFTVLS